MAYRKLPDVETLRQLFFYDKNTGNLYRKVGFDTGTGYLGITLNRTFYMAHRIIWAVFHGEDPDQSVIDHINGDTKDNRIINLRKVTHTQNMNNKRSRKKERIESDLKTLEKWKKKREVLP
jgi:hypothetical protein